MLSKNYLQGSSFLYSNLYARTYVICINYSIQVGKNNRYRNPNKEILNNLKKSRIYRTDQDGSIIFKIKGDKLQIETCTP